MKRVTTVIVLALSLAGSSLAREETRLNRVIERFERGGVAFGSFVRTGDIPAAVQARRSGLDFVIFEMEHSSFDLLGLRDSLQFLLDRRQLLEQQGLGPAVVPFVRIPANADERNLWLYKQVLDLGVYGVVTPHFGHSVEAARSLVAAARYPQAKGASDLEPAGHRGVLPSSYQYWGLDSFAEYHRRADVWPLDREGELALLPIVEDREGVENIGDVLRQVKGIAGVFIGEVDLATSLGYPGETDHPEVEAAMDRVLAIAKELGVPAGALANRRNIVERVQKGFQFLVTSDPIALEAGRRAAAASTRRSDASRVGVPDRLNRVIDLLAQGKPVFGGFAANGDVSDALEARSSNWDFVIFEMEHTGFGMLGLQKSLQYLLSRSAVRKEGLSPALLPLVRIGPGAGEIRRNQGYVKQVLDYGVYGLVVPHLDSAEHAIDIVQAARYPQRKDSPRPAPPGLRGTAPGNAQAYWGLPDFEEYWERSGIWPLDPEGEMLLIPIIEDAAGAAAIEGILREVKGLGVVLIGPADLSTSLGYPGEPDRPEVREIIDRIARSCKAAGVPFGTTTDRDRVEAHVRAGYQFLITSDEVAVERGRRAGGR
jgi:4-hydroxy-2-oxoheptanedioate aldolase